MIKRMTIEIAEKRLARARRALGCATARATFEEAPRRAADQAEREHEGRAARQRRYLSALGMHCDMGVLASEEMWR